MKRMNLRIKLRSNPMAAKYLSVRGKELKEAGEAQYKANKAKAS